MRLDDERSCNPGIDRAKEILGEATRQMGWMNGDVDREKCLCRLSTTHVPGWVVV